MHISAHNMSISSISSIMYLYLGFVSQDLQPCIPGLRVWWGSWTYYFDPAEAAESGSRINWYKLGPGKDAWWHG